MRRRTLSTDDEREASLQYRLRADRCGGAVTHLDLMDKWTDHGPRGDTWERERHQEDI